VAVIPRPKPCFLDGMLRLGYIHGNMLWRSRDGKRYYTWDSLHGEIEVFNKRGRHLGAADALTGQFIKDPIEGRSIRVS
jgi:Cytotoxic